MEIDFSFKQPEDGFFLKSPYNKFKFNDGNLNKENFIITGEAQEYDIVAKTGTFQVDHTIPGGYINALNAQMFGKNSESSMHHSIVSGMHVSAHILADNLSPKWPVLQVLLHTTPTLNVSKLCGQVFVQNNAQELSGVCGSKPKVDACVVSVVLPVEWWLNNGSTVHVFYSVSRGEQGLECGSTSNSIVPVKTGTSNSTYSSRQSIAVLNLIKAEDNYVTFKDQHVIFNVPTETFHPGTRFEIPVKLEPEYDLQNLIMR